MLGNWSCYGRPNNSMQKKNLKFCDPETDIEGQGAIFLILALILLSSIFSISKNSSTCIHTSEQLSYIFCFYSFYLYWEVQFGPWPV